MPLMLACPAAAARKVLSFAGPCARSRRFHYEAPAPGSPPRAAPRASAETFLLTRTAAAARRRSTRAAAAAAGPVVRPAPSAACARPVEAAAARCRICSAGPVAREVALPLGFGHAADGLIIRIVVEEGVVVVLLLGRRALFRYFLGRHDGAAFALGDGMRCSRQPLCVSPEMPKAIQPPVLQASCASGRRAAAARSRG